MAQPEFLAGTLRVLILSELSQAPSYGYAIAKAIDAATGGELVVRPESLYPVLHRMEQEGLLEAKWEEAEGGRPRKVYRITPKGRRRWDKTREKFVRVMGGALRAIGEVDTRVGADPVPARTSKKGGPSYEPAG
jgi:PadR family transcriptional regulator, regulatory protein PadR